MKSNLFAQTDRIFM